MKTSFLPKTIRLLKKHFTLKNITIPVLMFCHTFSAYSQNYFQQQVNYLIKVTLNDRRHELNGAESVEYINNSPDTLTFIYFHLWPNAYSSNNTALGKELISRDGHSQLFNDPELKGYIDSLNFTSGNKPVQWNYLPGSPDICKLVLDRPLKPGDSINISTPFHVKIPKGVTSRLGHIGESYQISQWYPKPAVYDKNGWHQMPYLDQGEFYSEYGNFDVSITLPANYVVGASGKLQNEYEKKWLDFLAADSSWMKTIDYEGEEFPPSQKQVKTLRYTGNNIHDFAWFADKRFHVLKGIVRLPVSGKEVTTWAMFTNREAYLWRKSISYINSAIWYFSEWNGDYPYDSYTAVQSALTSGSGMEYPGISVIGLSGDPYYLDEIIAHEICHNWFYSSLGSDERRYPFMDESITSANESRYTGLKYPEKKLWEVTLRNRSLAKFFHIDKIPLQRLQELEWLIPDRDNLGQALNLSAPEYTVKNYESMIYSKAAQGFNSLRSYLGDQMYDSIMHDYCRIWKNRHPGPEDLKAVFQSHSPKDLSWFFDDFICSTKKIDYKIVRYSNQKVLLRNKGQVKSPVLVAEMRGDTIISERWEDGFSGHRWISLPENNFTSINLDPDHITTELYRTNDNIRTTGIFRKSDPLKLQYLYTIEDPDKWYLFYSPIVNWNNLDGFMAGIELNNGVLFSRKVQYFIMPFYTFRNKGLTGTGKITFNKTPYNSFIRLASLTLEAQKFRGEGYQYYKIYSADLNLFLTSPRPVNGINQKFFMSLIYASNLKEIDLEESAGMRGYMRLGYYLERKTVINPFNMTAAIESSNSYKKLTLEYNYKFSYGIRRSGAEIRFFTGALVKNISSESFYALSPAGRSGREQYFYSGVYPERFTKFHNSFLSRQMTFTEGGLVSAINDTLGYSKWLCSLSFSANLPGRISLIPVKPFANLLLNDHAIASSGPSWFFEAGMKAGLWDFFEIYFPFVVSDNINSVAGSLKERIRFTFRLDKLNPANWGFKL